MHGWHENALALENAQHGGDGVVGEPMSEFRDDVTRSRNDNGDPTGVRYIDMNSPASLSLIEDIGDASLPGQDREWLLPTKTERLFGECDVDLRELSPLDQYLEYRNCAGSSN